MNRKSQFLSNPKERQYQRMFKLLHNCTHFTCEESKAQHPPNQASILREHPDVQAWFRKGRRTRDQVANIHWIIGKKAREFQKKSTSASLTALKPLTVWITTVDNSSRDWNNRSSYLPPAKPVCSSRSNKNQTWNDELVQNWERSMSKLYIVTMLI